MQCETPVPEQNLMLFSIQHRCAQPESMSAARISLYSIAKLQSGYARIEICMGIKVSDSKHQTFARAPFSATRSHSLVPRRSLVPTRRRALLRVGTSERLGTRLCITCTARTRVLSAILSQQLVSVYHSRY